MKPKQEGEIAISLPFIFSSPTLYFPSSISPISPFWTPAPRQNLEKHNFEVQFQLRLTGMA